MKNNFVTNINNIYNFLKINLHSQFEIIKNPFNPFILENADILVSSYLNSYLILYLTKEQSSDKYYLLYRIYLLKLTYPNETSVILYIDEEYLDFSRSNINVTKFCQMGEIRIFNCIKEIQKFILTNTIIEHKSKEFNIIKNENFFRANLLFMKNYHYNLSDTTTSNFKDIKENIHISKQRVMLYDKQIINYNYYLKESLISIDELSIRNNKIEYLKKMAYYSFLNNFVLDYDYLNFNQTKILPNSIIFDSISSDYNFRYIQNALSFSNVFFTKAHEYNKDFDNYFYEFGNQYNDKLAKYRKFNETKYK